MNEEITVIIVDDESASIRNLSNDLSSYSDIRILDTTTSVEKARKIIKEKRIWINPPAIRRNPAKGSHFSVKSISFPLMPLPTLS